MSDNGLPIGIVVIGRNEGERLKRCLKSCTIAGAPVVYVDSDSSDGSVSIARELGVDVVELTRDQPLSAARGRNAGATYLSENYPGTEAYQFLDGDCILDDDWLGRAWTALSGNENIAAVCGRLREEDPGRNWYHLLADIEWGGPTGEITSCGGIAMVRRSAFERVGGFDLGLIAGEEPELCARLRAHGNRIVRLDKEMATHDIAMSRFAQWWTRARRAGHAYAQVTQMHPQLMPDWVRQVRSYWCWGLLFPSLVIVIALIITPWALWAFAAYVLFVLRIVYRRMKHNSDTLGVAAVFALSCLAAKWAQLTGDVQFRVRSKTKKKSALIEYKKTPPSSVPP